MKGCQKMYCLVEGCGKIDETHTAHCIEHGRSHHGICGEEDRMGTGFCKECKIKGAKE